MIELIIIKITPTINSVPKIHLLYFASQFGKYISKLSIEELEYFLATMVNGQLPLNISSTSPSPTTNATDAQE